MNKFSRRDFFRKSTKKILPIMAIIAFSSLGVEKMRASSVSDCKGCSNNCSGDCSGSCTGSCNYGCDNGCKGGCTSCKGSCEGSNAQCTN